jgi:hypothetical protein
VRIKSLSIYYHFWDSCMSAIIPRRTNTAKNMRRFYRPIVCNVALFVLATAQQAAAQKTNDIQQRYAKYAEMALYHTPKRALRACQNLSGSADWRSSQKSSGEPWMKTPGPAAAAPPPPDAPGKGGHGPGSYDDTDPGFAARKRLEALEAVRKSMTKPAEDDNGEENDPGKGGSQEKDGSQDGQKP